MGLIYKILSLPKTVFFNLYYFPIKEAIKLPVFVSYKCRVASLGNRNAIHLKHITTGAIRIGVSEGSFGIGNNDISFWKIDRGGGIYVEDKCYFGRGCRISVGKDAELIFGKNFVANAECTISACKKIEFGNDCLLGWECTIIDGDGHRIVNNECFATNPPEEITIGNHIWIASNVTILKGTIICDNSVVSAHSCISKKFSQGNELIVGTPGKVVRSNIDWSHDGYR